MKIFFLNCNKSYYSSWNDIRESLRRKSIDIKDSQKISLKILVFVDCNEII